MVLDKTRFFYCNFKVRKNFFKSSFSRNSSLRRFQFPMNCFCNHLCFLKFLFFNIYPTLPTKYQMTVYVKVNLMILSQDFYDDLTTTFERQLITKSAHAIKPILIHVLYQQINYNSIQAAAFKIIN